METLLQTISDVEIRHSSLHGRGVFTARSRPAGEVLTVLDGQVVPHGGDLDFLMAHEWNAISEAEIMVRPVWTTYGFINHAPAPNLTIRLVDCTLRTRHAIPAGTELTLDYREHGIPEPYLTSDFGAYLR